MFKKVHLKLTLLCVSITSFIMIIMSLLFLYVSESGLKRNQLLSFKSDMNTFASDFENQTLFTHDWLSRMKMYYNYNIYILDSGIPFLYNILDSQSQAVSGSNLMQEALDAYNNQFSIYITESSGYNDLNTSIAYHTEYEFTSVTNDKKYYGSVINLGSSKHLLQAIVIYPLDSLQNQIMEQRILFLIINMASLLVLTVFSWFFTRQLLKPIEKNQKSQIEFVSSASHELRTPLAVILSCTESCKSTAPDKQEGFINTIQSEAVRMGRLIEDMLTLSLSDDHRFTINKSEVQLDTLVLNFYEVFESMAKEKSIFLSVRLPETPAASCFCDSDRIGQVMAVLLHNAISYTPEKGKICVSLSKKKDKYVISVSDNGPGISDEDKTKIFSRFYRVQKSRSTKGHFGLGLCIAYEIVKLHQGSIKVSDTPGGGSTFTVLLPE